MVTVRERVRIFTPELQLRTRTGQGYNSAKPSVRVSQTWTNFNKCTLTVYRHIWTRHTASKTCNSIIRERLSIHGHVPIIEVHVHVHITSIPVSGCIHIRLGRDRLCDDLPCREARMAAAIAAARASLHRPSWSYAPFQIRSAAGWRSSRIRLRSLSWRRS